jgi:hypothetical protein
VKLNNIEAARLLLDKLYTKIDADEQAHIIKHAAPDVPDKALNDRYIFTVKVVLGENLMPVKSTSANPRIDSFVTLSDERGAKIAKTRTIYETPDPRWDELFDIPVEKQMWLAATVWDRKLVGEHNLCGRAYLRLDPRYFGDFLAHELWLDLDTRGRLLLRVSMEGEKDDILFYFGRAFRSLKRAEGDMVRIIVDKVSELGSDWPDIPSPSSSSAHTDRDLLADEHLHPPVPVPDGAQGSRAHERHQSRQGIGQRQGAVRAGACQHERERPVDPARRCRGTAEAAAHSADGPGDRGRHHAAARLPGRVPGHAEGQPQRDGLSARAHEGVEGGAEHD